MASELRLLPCAQPAAPAAQVYIPEVNYLLMLGTLAVVLIFKSSAKIGAAYGESSRVPSACQARPLARVLGLASAPPCLHQDCCACSLLARQVLLPGNPGRLPFSGHSRPPAPLPSPPTGLAVITVMLMTTCLAALVMVLVWELPLPLVAAFWLVFSFIEAAFFSSGLAKVRGVCF